MDKIYADVNTFHRASVQLSFWVCKSWMRHSQWKRTNIRKHIALLDLEFGMFETPPMLCWIVLLEMNVIKNYIWPDVISFIIWFIIGKDLKLTSVTTAQPGSLLCNVYLCFFSPWIFQYADSFSILIYTFLKLRCLSFLHELLVRGEVREVVENGNNDSFENELHYILHPLYYKCNPSMFFFHYITSWYGTLPGRAFS